jgi:hypothetical protein
MLKIASRALGIGPKECMKLAERLYLSGFLSYPRTETTRYPKSFDCREAVSLQTSHPKWGDFASKLLSEGLKRPRAGVDAGDHPPITPCRPQSGPAASGAAGRLYEMVTRHFLATLAGDCETRATRVVVECGGETFSVSGLEVVEPGFTEVQPHARPAETELPAFLLTEGAAVALVGLALRAGETRPPGPLAEHELISLMERHGIGTDASMAAHIANIVARRYVALGPGRTLSPTALGATLAHGYHRIDAELVLPRVRAAIEHMCDLVAAGRAEPDAVLDHALSVFSRKFQFYAEQIAVMDGLFEASESFGRSVTRQERRLSRCGRCKSYMRHVAMPTPRLVCPQCQETWPLPRRGTVAPFEGQTCPLDGFGLVLYSPHGVGGRSGGRSGGGRGKARGKKKKRRPPPAVPLCPCCFSRPPFEGLEDMACSDCLNAGCEHSLIATGICPCPDSAGRGVRERARRGGGALDWGARRAGSGGASAAAAGPASTRSAPAPPAEAAGCGGTMVLDAGAPAHGDWKLGCNRCRFVIRIHNVERVRASRRSRCEACGAKILVVRFSREGVQSVRGLESILRARAVAGAHRVGALKLAYEAESGAEPKLEEAALEFRGCIVCDDVLNAQTEAFRGQAHTRQHSALLRDDVDNRAGRKGRRR